MKNYNVHFITSKKTISYNINAENKFEAAKAAIIEWTPDTLKKSEIEYHKSSDFPKNLEALILDYNENGIDLVVDEMNEKFTQNGIVKIPQHHNLQDLIPSDFAFILKHRINCVINTDRTVTKTVDKDDIVEFEIQPTPLALGEDVKIEVLKASLVGSDDILSSFTTFQYLVFSEGGKIFIKNSTQNVVDCAVRIQF